MRWIAVDCAFMALALVYAELKAAPFLRGIPPWAAIAIVAVAVVPAAFRRCWPRTVLTLVVVAGAVATALSSSPVPWLAAACPPGRRRSPGTGLLPRGLGLSNTEIASRLHVSLSTAKTHVGRLLTNLGARDRAQLVIAAYNTGLVRPP